MGSENAKLLPKSKQYFTELGPHFPSSVLGETRKAFFYITRKLILTEAIEFVYISSATAILLEMKTCMR